MTYHEIYQYRCGHRRTASPLHYTATEDNIIRSRGLCWDCRQGRIGTRQTVVRYGDVPESGRSYNYAEGRYERGVSVYYPEDTHRGEFADRESATFTAVVIGYGSDGEPLINADTIEATNG